MKKIVRKLLWNIVEKMYSKDDHKPWHDPRTFWKDCQICHDMQWEKVGVVNNE